MLSLIRNILLIRQLYTTFYQGPYCDLHHHQQQHQIPGALVQILIYPIPYDQPIPWHKSDWDQDDLLQSPPVIWFKKSIEVKNKI